MRSESITRFPPYKRTGVIRKSTDVTRAMHLLPLVPLKVLMQLRRETWFPSVNSKSWTVQVSKWGYIHLMVATESEF